MRLSILLMFGLFSFLNTPKSLAKVTTIYGFKVPGLMGGTIDFSQFRGKKILVVNTASKCYFTPQYEGLEALYKKYKDRLVIVGFPANNFGHQEPGNSGEIEEFCKKNYGVSFPMAEKISVKGADMAPIYHWLTEKSQNGFKDSKVSWNFQKYLIDESGKLVAVFSSMTKPDSKKIEAAILKK